MQNRWLRFAPVVAWSAAIWFVSGMPKPPSMPEYTSDKTLHAVAYAAHGAAAWLALPFLERKKRAMAALAISTAWGGIDEIHQSFVPNRFASVLDFAADVGGAAVAVGGAWLVAARRERRAA